MSLRGAGRVPLYNNKLAPGVSGDANYPGCSFIYHTDVRIFFLSTFKEKQSSSTNDALRLQHY